VKKPTWLVARAFFDEAKCIRMCERSFVGLLVAESFGGILEAGFFHTFISSLRVRDSPGVTLEVACHALTTGGFSILQSSDR
jgi:hypothetical protein